MTGLNPTATSFKTTDILGVPVARARADDAIAKVAAEFAAGRLQRIAFLNANLSIALARAGDTGLLDGFTVFNDGVALDIAARMLSGIGFPDNLNGTDLTPRILASLPPGTRVFLYGARPAVVAEAARRIDADTPCTTADFADGYGPGGATIAARVRETGAEVVLVALGNPAQERWIAEHGTASGARLLMGVGAWFDFMTDSIPRAPRWMRRLRLEWLFRLAREPRRLGRRYTIDTASFLLLALKAGRRGAVDPAPENPPRDGQA